jgi:hypothetical protein
LRVQSGLRIIHEQLNKNLPCPARGAPDDEFSDSAHHITCQIGVETIRSMKKIGLGEAILKLYMLTL